MTASVHEFLLAYWEWITLSVTIAACLIFASSLDDLFLDLCYWLGFAANGDDPPATESIRKKPEQTAAVLIPAWREAGVIGAMLSRLAGTMDYTDYHVFVGTYPNDPDTGEAVREVAARFKNVHCIVVKNPGPTSKADCLNQLVQQVRDHEAAAGVTFGFFVMQDSEDVIHPLSLRVMNWFVDKYAMIQLPVLSLNRNWRNHIACHYMDEFAEWHNKDMIVRSRLTGSVPSAGVATAFSRAGIDMLRQSGGQIFNAASLTEDYEIAHRLHRLGGEAKFIRYFADMPYLRRAIFGRKIRAGTRHELVSTRELFPHRFETAVRQKARWILGISYFGWRTIGWYGNGWNRYFLMRDRKGMITAPAAMFGYLIVLEYLSAVGLLWMFPSLGPLPPLVRDHWVWVLILINFAFLVSRLVQRAWFVGRMHGLGYVWLSPVRAVYGNFVAFFAFLRATRMFLGIQYRARPIHWDKTDHRYPDAAVVKNGKPDVSEVLQHKGLITHADVNRAIANMHRTQRPLGLQLLDQGAIDDVSLAQAFAESEGGAYASFDPLEISPRTGRLLKPREAARFSALPWMRLSDKRIIVALGEPLRRRERRSLERRLRWRGVRFVSYVYAPLSDITFGVRYFYSQDEELQSARRQVARLVKRGYLTIETKNEVWRLARRSYLRLGDAVVRAGMANQTLLLKALRKCWRRNKHLGDVLRSTKSVPIRELNKLIAELAAWRPEPVAQALRCGFVAQPMAEQIESPSEANLLEALEVSV